MLPPVQEEARGVVGPLYRDDGVEPVGSAMGQVERDVPAERRAHEDRLLEGEGVAEGHDTVGEQREVRAAQRFDDAEVLPATEVHDVAADVTESAWLEALPRDRAAVIVADGLLAFLAQDAFVSLLHRLVDHFPCGEIAFNGYTRFHVWVLRWYSGTESIADAVANPGFDDPRDPERWEPRLHLEQEILLTREPEVAQYPLALRMLTRLAAHSTSLSRRGTTVLRYRFPT